MKHVHMNDALQRQERQEHLCLCYPPPPGQRLEAWGAVTWWGEGEECPRCLAILADAFPEWRANRESGRYCHHAGCSWNLKPSGLRSFRGVLFCGSHSPKDSEPDCALVACAPSAAPLTRCTAEGVCHD